MSSTSNGEGSLSTTTTETKPASVGSMSSAPPKERRFKLSRACDRCRRRRIKCDEGHPCQSCLTANSPCTFEEPGKRTHPHKSKRATTLEDRIHHLESLIQTIPFNIFAAQTGQPFSPGGEPSSPHASFASTSHSFPLGVPPPSLSIIPLMGPSAHFPLTDDPSKTAEFKFGSASQFINGQLAEETARMSVSPSYLYLDDEGYTRWQGETSGLPLLDFLVERELPPPSARTPRDQSPAKESWSRKSEGVTTGDWFPDRQPRRINVNPETIWKLITSVIAPDLMDSLVQCFLSTSYYLMPFLHVPTFLSDYGNPLKWGEPGFASFIVAICCLSSRHIDDPRVRADPSDGFSAGVQWFELFAKLRTLPNADRPTLYTVQSVFVAAVYAIGLGKLSRGFALLAEAATVSIDAGLHRSAEAYDCFDPIEEEVRKRTFWCVYMWDKQAGAVFGRPAMIRLRDCDVGEPALVDDEYITDEGVGPQPVGIESRLGAFVATMRIFIILESVLDIPHPCSSSASPFLARASSILTNRFGGRKALREEEALLDELVCSLPAYWAHTAETMASDNVIRVTQSERIHCLEQFVRMLIQRHRFSELVAERTMGGGEGEQTEAEREAMMACHECAIHLVHSHMEVAKKGLMTYYGVHVIHQLAQAGRTLIAVLLNCKTEDLQPLVPPSLEALRSCVGLLRRFSGRYICGLRSGELIEEFCRLTCIPLEPPGQTRVESSQSRPPWIRPVRKKTPTHAKERRTGGSSDHGSPEASQDSPTMNSISPTSPDSLLHPPFPLDTSPTSMGLGEVGLDMTTDLQGNSVAMSPGALMSMLNDGSFDMNALFQGDAIGLSPVLQPTQSQLGTSPSPNPAHSGGGFASSNGVIGITSP